MVGLLPIIFLNSSALQAQQKDQSLIRIIKRLVQFMQKMVKLLSHIQKNSQRVQVNMRHFRETSSQKEKQILQHQIKTMALQKRLSQMEASSQNMVQASQKSIVMSRQRSLIQKIQTAIISNIHSLYQQVPMAVKISMWSISLQLIKNQSLMQGISLIHLQNQVLQKMDKSHMKQEIQIQQVRFILTNQPNSDKKYLSL